jgi:hypothetical protein
MIDAASLGHIQQLFYMHTKRIEYDQIAVLMSLLDFNERTANACFGQDPPI